MHFNYYLYLLQYLCTCIYKCYFLFNFRHGSSELIQHQCLTIKDTSHLMSTNRNVMGKALSCPTRQILKFVQYLLHPIKLIVFATCMLLLWWMTSNSFSRFTAKDCPAIWDSSSTKSSNSSSYRPINCTAVFQEKSEIEYANQFKWCNRQDQITNSHYIEITQSCDNFKDMFGYLNYEVTQEENDFPIAFSILMHENVEQMERLLRMIYRPHNVYCIHVDFKASTDIQNAVRAIIQCFQNVILSVKQIAVRWAEYTVLEAELACMETLWKFPIKWKYFINLTGRDFPLKTNWELVQILKVYNGSNDIDGTAHRYDMFDFYNEIYPFFSIYI